MPTRLYFPIAETAPVSPAFDAGWGFTSEAVRRRMVLGESKADSGTSSLTVIGPWTADTTTRALDRQYVSDPLVAQTISGTIQGVIQVCEFNAGDNVDQVWVSVRVVSNDGLTVRGDLLPFGFYGVAAEFTVNNHSNRWIADGDAISSLAVLDGDRIVVEIGYGASGAAGAPATPEAAARWGASLAVSDLAAAQNNSGALNQNPWIEFSGDISFVAGPTRVTALGLEVASDAKDDVAVTALGMELAYSANFASLVTAMGLEVAYVAAEFSPRKRTRLITLD